MLRTIPRTAQTPWPVGTLVVDPRVGPSFPRMIVGYREDGCCLTVGAPDPPWERAQIRVDRARRFRCYRGASS